MLAVTANDELLELPVGDLLERLASDLPTPGGGAVAALAAAMAAGLVAMVARATVGWEDAAGVAAQAHILRARVAPLAAENAAAYEFALASFALPDELEAEVRGRAIGDAVARAAELPLRIAAAASDVALLAAYVAHRGEPALRADAAVAAVLAEAAARSAAHLVEVNLTTTEDDERVVRARGYAAAAGEAARGALVSAAGAP